MKSTGIVLTEKSKSRIKSMIAKYISFQIQSLELSSKSKINTNNSYQVNVNFKKNWISWSVGYGWINSVQRLSFPLVSRT